LPGKNVRRKKNSLTSGKKMIEKKAFVYEAGYARVRVSDFVPQSLSSDLIDANGF